MTQAYVTAPEDGFFFIRIYDSEDEDHCNEIRRFDERQYKIIVDGMVAAANRRLNMGSISSAVAGVLPFIEITNHAGTLCLQFEIDSDQEAQDIIDGTLRYNWCTLME
jgi:hypothetical protein